MIRKIIEIKNVGRLLDYSAAGDVELERYNLIFAENGRGKTTLCSILRSLQSGDAAHVIGRATLGSTEAPKVTIRTDAGNIGFSNGAWSANLPILAIFDSTFISENVYSGDAVGLDHKRNLYRVMIGKEGVDLAREVDDLDAKIRAKTAEIRDKRGAVQLHAPQGITVETFLGLQEDPEVDAKTAEKEKELEATRQADRIRTRGALAVLTIPTQPQGIEALLGKIVQGLATETVRRIGAHIAGHAMQQRGEEWLSEGRAYITNDGTCPFCGQSLADVDLIQAFSAYFGQAYQALRQEIRQMRTQIDTVFGDRAIAQVENTMEQNNTGMEFWSRYCEIEPPTSATLGKLGEVLRNVRQAIDALLEHKAAAPLDRIAIDQTYKDAVDAYNELLQAASDYNNRIRAANVVISSKKAATVTADINAVNRSLAQLRAVKAWHQPEARKACEAYSAAVREKEKLEEQKAAVRSKLDSHTQTVIGRYEKTMNALLDDFQAGFRISETKHSYPGGVPSSSFQLLINDVGVELGDATTPLDKPSFRNTLSSGDKSTLALAFFLAQLEHDADKAKRIVIFDDPFNSQDSFRKDHTVAKIKRCGEQCSQVVILSHDQSFLKRLWDRLDHCAADRKTLHMARIGLRNTAIAEWDIEKATQAAHKANRKALANYYNANEGKPRDIVNKIRPVLESHCRALYPSEFGDNDMLGVIISKIRSANSGHPLAAIVNDLDDLNEYTKRYHHGDNPNAATEPISDAELQGFVKKALTITGGC
jgi:wobble nucleotide-excising tRNase